jgi:hypothetical protein
MGFFQRETGLNDAFMRRLLIGILTLVLLLPFCPGTIEVAYAKEATPTLQQHQIRPHEQKVERSHDSTHHDEAACCDLHGGSDVGDHLFVQSAFSKSDQLVQMVSLPASPLFRVSTPNQFFVRRDLLYPILPFQINDFERRSEVIRR